MISNLKFQRGPCPGLREDPHAEELEDAQVFQSLQLERAGQEHLGRYFGQLRLDGWGERGEDVRTPACVRLRTCACCLRARKLTYAHVRARIRVRTAAYGFLTHA